MKTAGRSFAMQTRSVIDLIGNTPLLAFTRVAEHVMPIQVFAKAEWYNPGGSVKDRAALAMILDGERRGLLTNDKILLDATSGNTGIAYAMIAAERGYRVKLALPKNASPERKQSLLGLRGGTGFHRSDRRDRWCPAVREETVPIRPGQIFLSRSIQQRRQLAGAL